MNAPFVQGSRTSEAAAESIQPDLQRLEKLVVDAVRARGPSGATSDEIEVLLNLPHQTVSARFAGLKKRGVLIETEATRKTRSGRAAGVYLAKSNG